MAVAANGQSVAVLLFTNQSGDAAQDYFADGLTEDITRALGRFKQLTVMAYGAVLPYRGKQLPPMEMGHALGTRYLVGGSVRRAGDQVRVTVQLTDASNGRQLWAEQYDDEVHRHLPAAGPDRPQGRGHAGDQPAADRPAAEPQEADRQPRRLRPAAAGAGRGQRSRRAPATAWRARCWKR